MGTQFNESVAISKSVWKQYEMILSSFGEHISRKSCWVCGKDGAKSCAGCPVDAAPRYCSSACQSGDWKFHKEVCAIRNASLANCLFRCHVIGSTEWNWLCDSASSCFPCVKPHELPKGDSALVLPSKCSNNFVVRIDTPSPMCSALALNAHVPMFVCNKSRTINCFICGDSPVYKLIMD